MFRLCTQEYYKIPKLQLNRNVPPLLWLLLTSIILFGIRIYICLFINFADLLIITFYRIFCAHNWLCSSRILSGMRQCHFFRNCFVQHMIVIVKLYLRRHTIFSIICSLVPSLKILHYSTHKLFNLILLQLTFAVSNPQWN